IRLCPMADGGEGTLDAVLAAVGARGVRRSLQVRGAAGQKLEAGYGLLDSTGDVTAMVEAAQVVSITDPQGMAVPIAHRSTEGIGMLIAALLDQGIRSFMIGLGGSSTNDGGCGLLAALGLRMEDADGNVIAPTPAGLAALSRVDAAALDPRLAQCELRIMSDVNNPLCGAGGATAIFGPQKGVAADEVATLDARLARFGDLAEVAVGRRAAMMPGAGAAGGLGFALQLVGGRFASGADVIASLVGLPEAMAKADWAITGEGRSDAQTLLAKAPFVVARLAAVESVPVTLISGAIDARALPALREHFTGCFGLPHGPATLDACIAGAASLLEARAEEVARVFAAGTKATR
ncbi:MAG: glycerate kinase, partial [Casimicrobiaceae bacterium]